MKIFKILLLSLLLILLSACNFKNEKEIDEKIYAEYNKGITSIYSKENIYGIEIKFDKKVSHENISVKNKKFYFCKDIEGYTHLIIHFENTDEKIEIANIKNSEQKLNFEIVDIIEKKDVLELKNIKKSTGVTEELLGDFNKDGIIDVMDFSLFKNNYGSIISEYDIAPAAYGLKNGWENIYSIVEKDGKIDLKDLIVFSSNFGKKIPETTYKVNKIIINNSQAYVGINSTLKLEAQVEYETGEIKTEEVNWMCSDTFYANLKNSVLTGIKEGKIYITASKDNQNDSKEITVYKEQFEGTRVRFKKPASWPENVYIYYYKDENNKCGTWPGVEMINEYNGWYVYTIKEEWHKESKIMFYGNENYRNPQNMEPGYQLLQYGDSNEYWYDGKWHIKNPDEFVSVKAEPGTNSFENEILVRVYAEGKGNIAGKYTLDGTYPDINNGISFNPEKDEIKIGSNMSNGESKVLKLFATNGITEARAEYIYKKESKIRAKRLGAYYTKTKTTFSICSPETSDVKVYVGNNEYFCKEDNSFEGYSNIYSVTVDGDLHLYEYQFIINGKPVRDPYGIMIKNENGNTINFVDKSGASITAKTGSTKNIVVDLSQTEPNGGWAALPLFKNREDAVIYGLHIRDYTINENSGVRAENKGKYLGLVEKGTLYNGEKTGIDHLQELGITHVQIMPFHDFAYKYNNTAKTDYSWGYDALNFNVPEETYSKNSDDYIERIREVKTMINELHKAGIRVIMDVSFNHTFQYGVFGDISPKYYTSLNLSGWDNTLETYNDITRKLIRDSLEYWISEYNVDGFKFDLMGVYHYEAVRDWGEYLNNKYPDRNLLIYGEPWNGAEGGDNSDPYVEGKARLGKMPLMASGKIGAFNVPFRDVLKGSNNGSEGGYIFNINYGNGIYGVVKGSRGAIMAYPGLTEVNRWDYMYAYDPEQTINYVSSHNDLCIADKIKKAGKTGDYALRINKFSLGVIMTSQGIPFISEGDEFLRSKMNGEYEEHAWNSYIWGDKMNGIDWSMKSKNKSVYNYYKDMIKLRKYNSLLRLNTWDDVNNYVQTYTDGSMVVTKVNANKEVDGKKEMMIIYNSGTDKNIKLNESGWKKIFDYNGFKNEEVYGESACEGTAVSIYSR